MFNFIVNLLHLRFYTYILSVYVFCLDYGGLNPWASGKQSHKDLWVIFSVNLGVENPIPRIREKGCTSHGYYINRNMKNNSSNIQILLLFMVVSMYIVSFLYCLKG